MSIETKSGGNLKACLTLSMPWKWEGRQTTSFGKDKRMNKFIGKRFSFLRSLWAILAAFILACGGKNVMGEEGLPKKVPGNKYKLLWENSPYTRKSIPEATTEKSSNFILKGTWQENDETFVILMDRSSANQERVMLSSKSDDAKNKLISFSNADQLSEIAAKVVVNGTEHTVKFDETELASSPAAGMPDPQKMARPVARPVIHRNPNSRNTPTIIRRPNTPGRRVTRPTQNRSRRR